MHGQSSAAQPQPTVTMMKTFSLAALVASASAFAPSQQVSRSSSSALAAKAFADEIGAQMPLGMFDPLGIMEDGDKERFEIFREIEIKHGRVAMLAVVGYLVTYVGVRFPGAESIPSGFGAFNALLQTPENHNVLYQMMMFFIVGEIWNHDKTGKAEFRGDFRNDIHDFGWAKQSDAWKTGMRAKELNNGRAAQMGILALMTHECIGNVDVLLPWAQS